MAYRVTINTNKYKDRRCSKENWEPGTMNDFIHAINGWSTREKSIKELRWRIYFLSGKIYSGVNEIDYDRYKEWENKRKNYITFYDNLCEFERTEPVVAYGFAQGYFDVEKVIAELKKNNSVEIPFKWFYDARQYCKNMDGCFVLIEKV